VSSILITGSGRGIGRATALELVRRGHRVIATARDTGQLVDLPVDVRLQLDVTDEHSIEQAIRAAGHIDVLISNAGGMFMAPVEATPPDQLERLLQQNTVGALRVIQAVLPGMRERGRAPTLSVEEVATAIGDVIEADVLPLRIPVGEAARRVLAARQAAPDDAPFRLAPVTW
jgi:NADP-dependent 3-hydroxy acid dehydrogenase YdfG